MILGLQLTVEPINLLNAVAVWNDTADYARAELLDRIERILRGDDGAKE